MAIAHWYTDARRADADLIIAQDLVRLIHHLHFFAGVALVLRRADLWNEIERDRMSKRFVLVLLAVERGPAAVDEIALAAVPQREDPRDVVVARDGLTLGELPVGSRIGTGSPRRAAQLHALGLGFVVEAIRGNVDTRIGKVTGGELDAVVLARSGIARLGRLDEVTEVLDPLQMLPAPGQGALAVECRASDAELAEALRAALDDPPTRAAVTAERSFLRAVGGGCRVPVAGHATVSDGKLSLVGFISDPDGEHPCRGAWDGAIDEAEAIGRALAGELLARAHGSFLAEVARG